MTTETYSFTWRGIEIEATYTPLKYDVIALLEIKSINPPKAPLPITLTGYLSHFHPPGTIEAHGGDVIAQVTSWLDEGAAKPEWLEYLETSRQGDLFS